MTPALEALEAAGAAGACPAGGRSETSAVDVDAKLTTLGSPWTRDEHLAFLRGLQELGKGRWKDIAKRYVVT